LWDYEGKLPFEIKDWQLSTGLRLSMVDFFTLQDTRIGDQTHRILEGIKWVTKHSNVPCNHHFGILELLTLSQAIAYSLLLFFESHICLLSANFASYLHHLLQKMLSES